MKCVNCEMEWSGNEKITATITKCPFCGEDPNEKKEEPKHHENTKDALAAIYKQFGADVLLGRLNGYLPDFAPSVSLADKELVYNVNKMGSSKALKEADKGPREEKERAVKIAVRNLIDAYVAPEVAEKIIYEFTEALGWDIKRSSLRADEKPESQLSADAPPKIKHAAASKKIKPSKVTRNNTSKPVMNAPQKGETLSKDMIGNANRGKYITSEGNWIYYRNEECNLYKIRTDGTGRKKLTDRAYSDIKVNGDWIYYKNGNRNICRIKTDGTSAQELTTLNDPYCLNVAGGWIYYTAAYSKGEPECAYWIFRMRMDGKEKELIIKESTTDSVVDGDWIYYTKRENDGIHKMRINGTEKCQINSDHSHDLCVLGEWIYYKNISDGRKLYKIRKDGSNKQKLNDDACYFGLCAEGDWVYYVDEGKWNIYKIRTDGTDRQKLSDKRVERLGVLNGCVYIYVQVGVDKNSYPIDKIFQIGSGITLN